MLEHVEVAVNIDTGANKALPVNTLELDVGVVLLELELHSLVEVDIRPLNSMHILPGHLELREVVVFWEHLHI